MKRSKGRIRCVESGRPASEVEGVGDGFLGG